MKQVHKDWVAGLDGAVNESAQRAQRREQKEAILMSLISGPQRSQQRHELYLGSKQAVGVEDADGQILRRQTTLAYGTRDQTLEMDLAEQEEGFRMLDALGDQIEEWDPYVREDGEIKTDDDGNPIYRDDPQERFQKQLNAQRIIDSMVSELQSATTGGDNPVPLFTDEEIIAEIYDPLVRRGLIPETSVPDRFSRTQEMLDGSFDAYAKRLEREGLATKWSENKDLIRTAFTSTVAVVANSVALADTFQIKQAAEVQMSFKPEDNINNLRKQLGMSYDEAANAAGRALTTHGQIVDFTAQGIEFALDIGVDGISEIADRLGEDDVPDRVAKSMKLANLMISTVASSLGTVMDAYGLGMAVSSNFGTSVKPKPIAIKIAAEELYDDTITEIVNLLKVGYTQALEAIDPEVENSDEILETAADRMGNKLAATLDSTAIIDALDEEQYDRVLAKLGEAADAAANDGMTDALTQLLGDRDNQRKAKSAASEALQAELEADEDDTGVTATADELGDAQMFAGMLDRKLAELKKHESTLQWAATIGSMGFNAASNVLGPLMIAGSAITIMKNVREAHRRHADLLAFVATQESMCRAASAYSSAVSNFMHNSAQQGCHYTLVAAYETIKFIGAIISCTPIAPVGAAMTITGDIALALEAVVYEASKRFDLEKAWKTYALALENPANRKLGLIALKKNATLAKYAVAWGAVVKKDPLVGDFIHTCGLTADTLKDPAANIDKVVEYLEARMPDDNVVVGRMVVAVDWAPAEIDLTAACWLTTKKRGETDGDLKPDPKSTRSLELSLGQLEPLWKSVSQAHQDQEELDAQDASDCAELLSTVASLFSSYVPKGNDDKLHYGMGQVKDRFANLCRDRQQELSKWPVADGL